jgi:hypothetical protein
LPKLAVAAASEVRTALEAERAEGLLGVVQQLRAEARVEQLEARGAGDRRTTLAAIDVGRKLLETEGKLAGVVQTSPTINIDMSTTNNFQVVTQRILVALAPPQFREAKQAVLAALELLEHEEVPR